MSIFSQLSEFGPDNLGYYTCPTTSRGDITVNCQNGDLCCCYSDSANNYPYCCSCTSYVWVYIMIVVIVAVIVTGIIICVKKRQQRAAMMNMQYNQIGTQPILQNQNGQTYWSSSPSIYRTCEGFDVYFPLYISSSLYFYFIFDIIKVMRSIWIKIETLINQVAFLLNKTVLLTFMINSWISEKLKKSTQF